MPNYQHLLKKVEYAVAEINKLREILNVIEEGCNNPQRVKLMVQIYASNLELIVDDLNSIANQVKKRQLETAKKRCKAS